jgi:hypothetical protein
MMSWKDDNSIHVCHKWFTRCVKSFGPKTSSWTFSNFWQVIRFRFSDIVAHHTFSAWRVVVGENSVRYNPYTMAWIVGHRSLSGVLTGSAATFRLHEAHWV